MSPKKKIPQHIEFIKAYDNHDFLNSPGARTIRVLSELLEPAERLRRHHIHNTVVFFGSARTEPLSVTEKRLKETERRLKGKKRPGSSLIHEREKARRDVQMSQYYEDAVELARRLTVWFQKPENSYENFKICSGGGPGIMEAANRGAQKAGGESIGLNISIPSEQNPNIYQTKEISFEFHYFFIRKFWFFYLAKALIVFPGGFGTLDEFFELVTLIQTEKTKKYMPVILYGQNYWEEVFKFEALLKWGMISKEDLHLFRIINDVDSAFNYVTKELKKHYIRGRRKSKEPIPFKPPDVPL